MGSPLEALSSQLVSAANLDRLLQHREVLATGWPELDAVLPDHGFVPGVTELTAPHGQGGGSSIALALVRAQHGRDARSWAAWVEDPSRPLYAPALAQVGVDLNRLLVVRPDPRDARRVASKVALSGAFEVVVVDMFDSRRNDELFIRKLTLAKARVLVLTDSYQARRANWPTTLRLELSRRADVMSVRVAKDRGARVGKLASLRSFPWVEPMVTAA